MIERAAAIAAINALPDVTPTPTTSITTPPITSSVRRIATGLTHEYSTMWPGDANHRAIILFHPNGFCGLHYQDDGRLYTMLPADINHASQPRWRSTEPDKFIYLHLNQIREFDCGTLTSRTIKVFDQFPNINGMGESDISEDDDHIILCSGLTVFVYQLSTDKIIHQFTAAAPFDSLYLPPNNVPIISYYGSYGIRQLGTVSPIAGKNGHMDVGSDEGGHPILVWCNSGDDTGVGRAAETKDCPNGIEIRDLRTRGRFMPRCLLTLDWSIAVHISLPKFAKFALVTTYDPLDPSSTVPHANEILKVMLSDGTVTTLVAHGADSSTYEGKPRAAVSPDGTRYIYDSRGDVFLGVVPTL